jgi:uncharacterized protein (TIGR03085 family)
LRRRRALIVGSRSTPSLSHRNLVRPGAGPARADRSLTDLCSGAMSSFAHRERLALCDTALREGSDAPTLCDPWDVKQLVCHLLVRERNPVGAAGIAIGPLSGLTGHAMERLGRTDFGVLVERLRSPRMLPWGLPGVEQLWNTLEFYVHHEDIRRAQTEWAPRSLAESDEGALWSQLRLVGRGLARPAGVPVRIEWDSRSQTLRGGEDPVVVRGVPSEIALVLQGRARVAQVKYDGPDDAIARLRGADLGI